ncbi:MAG: CoA transferase [Boseongicola sp. SB0676_bin_33]|nr:CoA transferase [Boseongicola sp. SB0676_bin_33]
MAAPLSDILVLDLTNVLAGPFCCHQLAHLGAEVIKVERPGSGDLARRLGADARLNAAGMGASFLAQNAGKKSVTLNLKSAEGKSLLKRLAAKADVLVENFRPGVMERLGLGHDVLKDVNAKLTYCAISGFGQDGPWVDRPAYDQIIQGASGVMSITGTAECAPTRVGYPVADTVGGLTAAFAITAALNKRPRGAFIDVSMLESVLATMGWVVSNHLIADVIPEAHGNENPTSAPSGTFSTATDPINVAANSDNQWVRLTDHLGLACLRDRTEYATREVRKGNRDRLRAEIEAVLVTRPAKDWVEELNRIGVPAGAVLTVPEVLRSEQIAGRGFLAGFVNAPGVGRDIKVARTGVRLDREAAAVDSPPPELGQHNREIWGRIGISGSELERLERDGII